ncbi:MAG: hypothetical protein HW405_463 [Candidatus Berkelbacteria bacterium]|nr:hypothetical protein [Candidatus Berkelbacteria bacterium]
MTVKNQEQNYQMTSAGIRLYVEDPRSVIKRQVKRSFWVILITAVITAGALFLAIKTIKDRSTALNQKQNLLVSSLQSSNIDINLQANWDQIAPYRDKINNALPDPTNMLDYQGALEQVAQTSGVQISVTFASGQSKAPSNIPGQTKKATANASLDHTVAVKGTFSNIISFMENLENMPYFVQVNTYTISTPQRGNNDASANLSLKVYTK